MTLTATPIHSFLTTGGQDIDLFPVSSAPMSSEVTVSEAATLLDVAEDFVEALIKIDVLKYRKDDGFCLVDRDNLLEYKQRRERKHAGLVEMCRMSQEMGLYND